MILWRDASVQHNREWHNPTELEEILKINQVASLGFVIDESIDSVCLMQTICDDGDFQGFIVIPKSWIRKRQKIKVTM